MVISGRVDNETLMLEYETIVRLNSEVNGSFQYLTYFRLLKSYAQIIAEYTVAKALLMKIAYVIDYTCIEELRKRGYKISLNNTTEYTESITNGLHRVSNMITKATMKRKEIEKFSKIEDKSESYQSIVAGLNFSLGFVVQDNITLSAYNEYRRILKARFAQQQKENHGR